MQLERSPGKEQRNGWGKPTGGLRGFRRYLKRTSAEIIGGFNYKILLRPTCQAFRQSREESDDKSSLGSIRQALGIGIDEKTITAEGPEELEGTGATLYWPGQSPRTLAMLRNCGGSCYRR